MQLVHMYTFTNRHTHTHLCMCRLCYFIGMGVGAGANILTRYAVSSKFGLWGFKHTSDYYYNIVQCKVVPRHHDITERATETWSRHSGQDVYMYSSCDTYL